MGALRKPEEGRTASPTAAERYGVVEMPDLVYDDRVARETASLYEKVRDHIPAIEWPVFAPYVAAINRLKKERGAVVLAHNYQTPRSSTASPTSSAIPCSSPARRRRSMRPSSCSGRALHGRDVEAAQS